MGSSGEMDYYLSVGMDTSLVCIVASEAAGGCWHGGRTLHVSGVSGSGSRSTTHNQKDAPEESHWEKYASVSVDLFRFVFADK